MEVADAAVLIAAAVPAHGKVWADLGAGDGIFSRALVSLLGSGVQVHAVDREPGVVRLARSNGIVPLHADFRKPLTLPELDGALFANSMHFVDADSQAAVLRAVALHVRPNGVIVVVEYEDRAASRSVPAPISFTRLVTLAREASLGAPRIVGTRRSAFGGTMYAACMSARVEQLGEARRASGLDL